MSFFHGLVTGCSAGIVLVARGVVPALGVAVLLGLTSVFLFSRKP